MCCRAYFPYHLPKLMKEGHHDKGRADRKDGRFSRNHESCGRNRTSSIYRRSDFLIEKGTTCLSRQFRHLYDFKAKSTNGKESTDRRITSNTSSEGPEVFSWKRASLCCEVMVRRLKRA